MHEASPQQYPHQVMHLYVVTDQGVVLGGPYDDEQTARAGGNQIAAELRASMRRERFSEAQVAERVRALRIGYGVRERPHGLFVGRFITSG